MAEQSEIVIDVKVDTGKVAEQLAEATKRVAELKQQQKELQKEIEAGGDSAAEAAKKYAANAGEIEANTRAIKSNTAMLQMQTLNQLKENATLDEQRQLLNAAQKAYGSMTAEQKAAAGGADKLEKQIKALSDSVKKQEAALGDNRRNVGNYTQSIIDASNQMGGFGSSIVGIIQPAKNATMVLKAMAATPLIAILAVLVTILMKLKDAFAKNDNAGTAFAKLMATFEPIVDGVSKVLDGLANALAKVMNKLAEWAGKQSDAVRQAQALVQAQDDLEEAERQYTVNSAKRNKEISELRSKTLEKEKYTAAERRKFLEQSIELEKQNLADDKKIKAEKLRILEETAKKESDTSDETADKIAQARAAMYQADQAYMDGTRRLQKELTAVDKEEAAARAQIRKENEQKVLEAAQKLAAIRDEMTRRVRSALENQVADLEKKRDEELKIEGLTNEERLRITEYYNTEVQKLRDADKKATEQAEKEKLAAKQAAREEFGIEPGKTPEEAELEKARIAHEQGLLEDEEYELAKTEIQNRYAEERAKTLANEHDKMVSQYKADLKESVKSAAAASQALASAFGEFAEESEAAAVAQKAFTMVGIITNQAQAISEGALAIAKGVESAAAIPFPANIPAIISVTAQIGAMIAGVMTSISQARQLFATAETQKFATGGIVQGNSYSGDRVPVMANSGEMWINSESQQRLFEGLTGNGDGTLGVNYEMMAAAIAAQQPPVVVYTELQEFGQKVTNYNEIASI